MVAIVYVVAIEAIASIDTIIDIFHLLKEYYRIFFIYKMSIIGYFSFRVMFCGVIVVF